MRYVKVLLLVLVFFLSMVFFFQNQEALSKEMTLKLHLFFSDPMVSIPLPFYFLILAAFLLGALLTICVLVWDKFHLSARLMKATWRVRALEKDLARMQIAPVPSGVSKFFSRAPKSPSVAKPETAPAPSPAAAPAAAPVIDKKD
ncbi:MAG: lipopolysaccharide assembly protein LapA domain-containing protein [Desulfovibrionaceae bacterium]